MNGVFLSYARSDDEPFARKLFERLRVDGFEVWFDRENMPGRSLTFLQEIRDAIRQRDRLVVILGPAAVKSDYVRAEWQAGLVEGKAVLPLLRLGDYDLVPPELQSVHCPDVREAKPSEDAMLEVLRILREPLPPLGVLSGAIPSVPPHFQPRPDDLSQLASSLLYEMEHPVVLDPPERTTVLHGMGGVGKSVLAAALARLTTTRRVFGDGVLWVELTTTSTPLEVVRNVLGAASQPLGGSAGLAEGVSALRGWLEQRRCLIVLDNAWAVSQIAAVVQAISPASRLLVTTRDGGLATSLGAVLQCVEALPLSAALVHLADWVGISVEDLPPGAQSVAEQCGGLPFALALQGALARDGVPWSDLLDALREADLTFARQQFPDYPYFDVLNVIQASVDMLRIMDAAAATRFLELGAFFWSEGVTTSALLAFWNSVAGLSPRDGRRLLVELQRKALIRVEGTPPVATVHDLVADYLAARSEVVQLRGALLDYYRAKCVDDWPSGPDDGYFHQHLIDHLAARPDGPQELARLLSSSTSEGRNAWFEASDRTANLDAYRRQLERRINDVSVDLAEVMTLVARLVSVNSLAGNVPPSLAEALVRSGIWTIKQALGYARQVPDSTQRAASLMGLFGEAEDAQKVQLMDESLAAVATMEEFPSELQTLIDALASAGRTDEALTLARRTALGDTRAAALATVARHLIGAKREAVISEAVEACANTGDVFRAAAIEPVLPLLDPDGVARMDAEAVAPLENAVARSWCEAPLVVRLVELDEIDAAWTRASSIPDALSRAEAVAACVARLPEQERESAADEVIATIGAVDMEATIAELQRAFSDAPKLLVDYLPLIMEMRPWLSEPLRVIAPNLTASQITTALDMLRNTRYPVFAAEGAAALAPVISPTVCEALIGKLRPLVSQERNEDRRMRALSALIGAARGDQRKELLEVAFGYVRGSTPNANALEKIAPVLQGDELDEALSIAAEIREPSERVKCVEALVTAATPSQLRRAHAVVMTIGDGDELLLAEAALSPALDADMHRELLNRAMRQDGYIRARTIALLAPQLEGPLFDAALRAIDEIEDPGSRSEVAMPALARRAIGAERRQILERAIEIAARMTDAERRVWALEAMIDQFDPVLRETALARFTDAESGVGEKWRGFGRGIFLAVLAPGLSEPKRGELLDEALALVPGLETADLRRDVLSRLAEHLDSKRWVVAVQLVEAVEDPYERAIIAGLLIGKAPESLRSRLVDAAIAEIGEIVGTDYDSVSERIERAGARVLAYGTDLTYALGLVGRLNDESWKRVALLEFASARPVADLEPVLAQVEGVSVPRDRALLKLALARRLKNARQQELVADALSDALDAPADLLHDDLLPELARALCELPDDRLLNLWRDCAPRLADRARPQMLTFVHGLAPVLLRLGLGGPTAGALFDVQRWWP